MGQERLTEHGFQAHEAADEAVEVERQVGLRVARDDQLVQLLVQFVPFPAQNPPKKRVVNELTRVEAALTRRGVN